MAFDVKEYYQKNKERIIEYNKEKYKENKEKKLIYQREYYKNNKDKISERQKIYKQLTKDKRNLREKQKRDNDNLYRLSVNIRGLITKTIRDKGYKKSNRTEEILGCTIKEFISYIESKFIDGMTLENHGEWHIDHIKPVSSARTEEELIKLNHYTNFQPLWAEDNLKKGKKIL